MSALIVTLHNYWLAIPEGIRAALAFAVAVLIAEATNLIKTFAWTMPTGDPEAILRSLWAQLVAFAAWALPVLAVLAVQLVRSKVAPAVVSWFLETFGYTSGNLAMGGNTRGRAAYANPAAWYKAA